MITGEGDTVQNLYHDLDLSSFNCYGSTIDTQLTTLNKDNNANRFNS